MSTVTPTVFDLTVTLFSIFPGEIIQTMNKFISLKISPAFLKTISEERKKKKLESKSTER